MEVFAVLGFIFGLVAFPFAIPSFIRILYINKELDELRKEIQALKK